MPALPALGRVQVNAAVKPTADSFRMKYDWTQKVVLITGASSGIGRALALELGKRGAHMGLTARRASELSEVAEDVARAGGLALVLPADVRSAGEINEVASRLREKFGGVDVLVAYARMSTKTPGTHLDAGAAAAVIRINATGAVNSVAAVLPDMLKRGEGPLVAISSLASYRGMPK